MEVAPSYVANQPYGYSYILAVGRLNEHFQWIRLDACSRI